MDGNESLLDDRTLRQMIDSRAPFHSLLSAVAPTHVVLDTLGMRTMFKLWAVAKTHMQNVVSSALRASSTRPALMIYSSDMTPMIHKMRHEVVISGKREWRESTAPIDWLLHRAYYLWKDI